MVDNMDSGTIHDLAETAGSENPIEALGAIAELHRALDRVESVAVRRARMGGASWQSIARALGVSRQAVHKKYGRC